MPIILPAAAMRTKRTKRALKPTKADRRVRENYYRALADQVRYLRAQTANLSDLVRSGADRSAIAARLVALAAEARARAALYAPDIAAKFVGEVDSGQKAALEQSIAKAMGVDFARVLDTPTVAADVAMGIQANVALITSISDQHFAEVGQAVLDNFRGVPLPEGVSLVDRLKQVGNVTDNRAKLIARDQTAKLTSTFNQTRQQANGIDEYKWRGVRDQREVGNPGGLYPKGSARHGNHWEREGKVFRWDTPPEDGAPGAAILCRCWAEPILNLEALKALYV